MKILLQDGQNKVIGAVMIMANLILSKKIDIKFESKWFTSQDYTIIIFLMKRPE